MAIRGGVTWSPEFEAFKRQLATLPVHLTAEADHLVEDAANGAAVAVRQIYGQHRVTGYLQSHVHVTRFDKGKVSVGWMVKSTSPLAWIFEHGTQARHYLEVSGVRHTTGRMPGFHAFIPTLSRFRRAMYVQLKAVLVRAGLLVSGEP